MKYADYINHSIAALLTHSTAGSLQATPKFWPKLSYFFPISAVKKSGREIATIDIGTQRHYLTRSRGEG